MYGIFRQIFYADFCLLVLLLRKPVGDLWSIMTLLIVAVEYVKEFVQGITDIINFMSQSGSLFTYLCFEALSGTATVKGAWLPTRRGFLIWSPDIMKYTQMLPAKILIS